VRAAGGVRAALAAMVAVTAVWGSTFLVVQDAVDRMPVTDFLTWRFGLATLAMVALRPRSVLALPPAGRRTGALLGLALAAGYLLQTLGLQTTPASVSGFLTGLFVVFTPLLGALLLGTRVTGPAWVAVGVATAGLALISLHGLSISGGALLTVGCAAAFALHIVGLGRWARSFDAYGLAVPQLAVTTLLCAAVAVPGGLAVPPDAGVWAALALTSLLATAVAFVVQTWAQQRLTPTRTAVVMTMEPVFALAFGVGVGGERLGWRGLTGAALVLVAMLLVEVGPRRGAEGAAPRLEV
jgi:drug/metabolite transporter (DMT)-like permease